MIEELDDARVRGELEEHRSLAGEAVGALRALALEVVATHRAIALEGRQRGGDRDELARRQELLEDHVTVAFERGDAGFEAMVHSSRVARLCDSGKRVDFCEEEALGETGDRRA